MSRRLVAWPLLALWTLAVCAFGGVTAAPADGPPLPSDGMPVITAGRERDIVALIHPWMLGQDVSPGWSLEKVQIEATNIGFLLKGPGGAERTLVLEYPDRAPQATERTKNFALVRRVPDGPAPSPDPLDVLAAAIRANDVGTFWPAEAPAEGGDGEADSRTRRAAPDGVPDRWQLPRALATDGVVLLVAALVFVLAHLRRQLRADPPWVAPALLGIVVVGAVLRALLPQENLMEAWAYERLAPLAGRIYGGPVLRWLSTVAGGRLFLSDVLFGTNYVLAVLTPLVLYAHARYILKDHRSALAAAALLVVLPEHLRFSRSDVYMIQSLATSSLTFVVLYTALLDRSRAWRTAAFLVLPLLCSATYLVRPENIIFVALDLGAIYICIRAAGGLSAASFLAALIVSGTALLAFLFNLLTHYGGSLEHGLSLQTLSNAVRILFSGRLNTLINPWITPPGMTMLAFLGAVALWRQGERPRTLFLVAWLVGFFLVHSFVLPYSAAMQARYHMNLITPLILLAAAATPVVLSWRPLPRYALAVYLAASPLLHRDFVRDTGFNEMREFAFLESLRDRIPPDCTVIEYEGLPGDGVQARQFASRVGRVASRLAGGEIGAQWAIVSAATVDDDESPTQASEQLNPEVEALLADPPPCLVFYEGLTCASLRRDGQERTPICQAIRDRLDLTPIATASFRSRIYDPVNAGYLGIDASGRSVSNTVLTEDVPVSLTGFRARRLTAH